MRQTSIRIYDHLQGLSAIATGEKRLFAQIISSSLVDFVCLASDDEIVMLDFVSNKKILPAINKLLKHESASLLYQNNALIDTLSGQIHDYLQARRQQFTVKTRLTGSEFQQKVWQQLCTIPYGQTLSYKQLAQRINAPFAHRAVANANGSNKLVLLCPCHRVIYQNGALGGFGGGLEIKRALLALEGVRI